MFNFLNFLLTVLRCVTLESGPYKTHKILPRRRSGVEFSTSWESALLAAASHDYIMPRLRSCDPIRGLESGGWCHARCSYTLFCRTFCSEDRVENRLFMWLAGGINIDIYLTFLPKANILSKISSESLVDDRYIHWITCHFEDNFSSVLEVSLAIVQYLLLCFNCLLGNAWKCRKPRTATWVRV